MAKTKIPNRSKRYPPEFRQQLVELHRAGRRISDLSREFGVSQWAISCWVKQADRDAGRGDGGLTTAEREELVRLRREVRQLKIEEVFGFVKANQDTLPVGVMCRLLSVSRSGFYAWHDRPMSARARRDVELTALIHQIHAYSYDGTYGAPRRAA